MGQASALSIADMKRANEAAVCPEQSLDERVDGIWRGRDACIERGLNSPGVLPGGLKVKRRAPEILHQLSASASRTNDQHSLRAMDWLSVYAMAVNEENAAGGRVVTAPTNGAAGVVPSVIR